MKQLTIGVVEHEIPKAENITLNLRKLGYGVAPVVSNYVRAIKMIEEENPDIILIDINLAGDKDAIDIAKYVQECYFIPIIFLIPDTNRSTINRIKEVTPITFLKNPCSQDDLYAGIEIAFANYQSNIINYAENYILAKDGYNYIRVPLTQILFLNSQRNYVTLHLISSKKVMVRSTIGEMADRLKLRDFFKVNRGEIINIHHIKNIDTETLFINDHSFHIAKKQRDELLEILGRNSV